MRFRNLAFEPWPLRSNQGGRANLPDGLHAIVANLLSEFPWSVRDREGKRYSIGNRPLVHWRPQQPTGRDGDPIRIFSSDQVRAAYAAPRSSPLRPRP